MAVVAFRNRFQSPASSGVLAEVVALPAPHPPDDAEIVRAIVAGYPQGPGRFYDAYARDIHRVVKRMLGPDADHEDLVHEIFLKAWKLIGAGKLREPERLGSWLRTLAVHTVYKEIRSRYVRRRFLLRDGARADLPVGSNDDHDLLRVLYTVAEQLAPADRLAFSLRHFEQRRLSDVAELLGCSLATTKRRLARAEARFDQLSRPYLGTYPALSTLFSKAELEP